MTADKDALLPCPFCKSTNLSHQSERSGYRWVHCDGCGAYGPWVDGTRETAEDAWNRRITAALEDDGWMPIETAPKDRNVGVLITGGFAYWKGSLFTESAPLNFIVQAYWNKDGDVYGDGGGAEFWYRPL